MLCLLHHGHAVAADLNADAAADATDANTDTESWWSRGYTLELISGPVTNRQTSHIVQGMLTFNRGGMVAIAGSKELADLGSGFALRGQLLVGHRFDGLNYDEFTFLLGMEYSATGCGIDGP